MKGSILFSYYFEEEAMLLKFMGHNLVETLHIIYLTTYIKIMAYQI